MGFEVFGVSVDTPEETLKMREYLELPFEVLCDTKKDIVTEWGIFNSKEREGIAHPNVYVLNEERKIVFHSKDGIFSRAHISSLMEFLEKYEADPSYRLLNQKYRLELSSMKDMLLALPRKFGWIKQ